MTSLLHDVLLGNQRPRLSSVPLGVASDGADAVDLAAQCGLFLDPWQAFCLECLLQKRADGRWVTRTGLVIVPRQNGKGAVDEAWELHRLFLKGSENVLHTAHHAKTAKNAFNKMRALIESSALLRKRLNNDRSGGIRVANGEWAFTFKTGQQLIYGTRTSGAGRGLTIDDTVVDEAQELSDAEQEAIKPTMATRPLSQTLMTGSAPKESSEVLPRLMARGRAGDKSLTYLEWSVDELLGDIDLSDRALWAQANPGYGIRLDDEAIIDERGTMSDEGFGRERLGIVDVRGVSRFSTAWAALEDESSAITGPVTLALEVSQDREWTCIAAAGERPDGLFHVETVKYGHGTSWVVDWLKNRSHPVVVQPNTEAGSLVSDLESEKVRVLVASGQDYRDACGKFHDAVTDTRSLRHMGQSPLNISVSAAKKKTSGNAWVWDRRNPKTDISPLTAATLALWGSKRKKRAGGFMAF